MKYYYLPYNSGIYCFENIITKAVYIGSAVCIATRTYNHIWHLIQGTHGNRHFQNAFNKYGSDSFIAFTLELCEKEKVVEREQAYFDTLLYAQEYINKQDQRFKEYSYNINPTAGNSLGFKHSNACIEYMTKLNIEKWQDQKFVEKFYATRSEEWFEEFKVRQQINGRYTNPDYIKKISEAAKNSARTVSLRRDILIYERQTGKLMTIAESLSDAAKLTDVNRGHVVAALAGKKRFKNFILKRRTSNDSPLQIEPDLEYYKDREAFQKTMEERVWSKQRKPVIQLDLQGNFIKEWSCSYDAAKAIGAFSTHIRSVANGKQNRTQEKGFKWIWKEKFAQVNNSL